MVLSMLLAITTCPAMLGTQEAIRDSQSKSRREEHRSRRCNLMVTCTRPSIRSAEINNKAVVLKDNKLYVDTPALFNEEAEVQHALATQQPLNMPHAFSGYFLPYPDASYEGLVSTITDVAPILNWIYVDRDTYEVKYGVRNFAQPNLTGPFDCTKQDRRMLFESWEGFVAVEETPGVWALYFDRGDDGLRGRVPFGMRVLEIELTRREKRVPRPEPDAAEDLEAFWKQYHAQKAKEEQEREEFLKSAELAAKAAAEAEAETAGGGGDEGQQEEAPAAAASRAAPMGPQEVALPPPSPTESTSGLGDTSCWSRAGGVGASETGTGITPPASERGEWGDSGDESRQQGSYRQPYVEAEPVD